MAGLGLAGDGVAHARPNECPAGEAPSFGSEALAARYDVGLPVKQHPGLPAELSRNRGISIAAALPAVAGVSAFLRVKG